MIALTRDGDAAAGPVDLAAAKAHCRVDHDDDDALIAGFILAATGAVTEMTGLVLGLEAWSFKTGPVSGDLLLPKTPARALTSLAYVDTLGQAQTATVGDFLLIADDARPFLRPDSGKVWPATAARPDAVTVTFTAGLQVVPAELRVACLMLIGHWYEHREAVAPSVAEMPLAAQALINLHRVGWAAA